MAMAGVAVLPPALLAPLLSSSMRVAKMGRRLRSAYGENNGGGWKPSADIAVPDDQKPANELASLKKTVLYSWAELPLEQFLARLGGLGVVFFIAPSAPIAAASFDPGREPLKFVLAAGAGSTFAVAVLILRMYLGWSYVGDRLLSAVVAYEETGWYDGQLWVKPPEVLARDRLLGSFQVKPIMNRLKQTLLAAGALLMAFTASLVLISSDKSGDVVILPSHNSPDGKVAFRKQDLLTPPPEVASDDDLAAAAAAAADGRPVYCTDRYFRARAGGQYCKWEDLRK